MFVVLLAFAFEFALACFSNLATILFASIRTTWYEYVSLVVIFGLPLFLFVFLYKKLVLVERRSLYLFLLCIGLTIMSIWLNKVAARKMINNNMNEMFLYRYSAYRNWLAYLRYFGKYVLIVLLAILSWYETAKDRNVQSDEIKWEDE